MWWMLGKPWISGEVSSRFFPPQRTPREWHRKINMLRGSIDISFPVKGDNGVLR